MASFSGLQLNTAGNYNIVATDTTHATVTSATSNQVTVNPGSAVHFTISAATTTPAAGAGDNLTITALDADGNTDPSYTGTHNLTFSGGTTIGSYVPTVTDTSGNADAFGTTDADHVHERRGDGLEWRQRRDDSLQGRSSDDHRDGRNGDHPDGPGR